MRAVGIVQRVTDGHQLREGRDPVKLQMLVVVALKDRVEFAKIACASGMPPRGQRSSGRADDYIASGVVTAVIGRSYIETSRANVCTDRHGQLSDEHSIQSGRARSTLLMRS